MIIPTNISAARSASSKLLPIKIPSFAQHIRATSIDPQPETEFTKPPPTTATFKPTDDVYSMLYAKIENHFNKETQQMLKIKDFDLQIAEVSI